MHNIDKLISEMTLEEKSRSLLGCGFLAHEKKLTVLEFPMLW